MDEIDDLLTPKPHPRDGVRDVVYAQTARVLRQRRWKRHTLQGLAWVVCFVAGGLCTWCVVRSEAEPIVAHHEPDRIAEQPALVAPVDPYHNEPPEQIERWAGMAQGERRTELYRQAGDSFLDHGDQLGALRCYRQALQSARRDDLIVHPHQDSWLLMALKFDRQKETTDAR